MKYIVIYTVFHVEPNDLSVDFINITDNRTCHKIMLSAFMFSSVGLPTHGHLLVRARFHY